MQITPVYMVYISQLIRYYIAYGSYNGFIDRRLLLTRKLLIQGFIVLKFHHHLESLPDASITCVSVMDDGYALFLIPPSFPRS